VTSLASYRACDECGAEVANGLLACPGCGRLVHADELRRLASAAEASETAGDIPEALASWRRAMELLPPGATQSVRIAERMRTLSAALDGRGPAAPSRPGQAAGRGKAGAAAAAVGVAVAKSKALLVLVLGNAKLLLLGLTKLPTLLTILLYARWMSGRGAAFGIGLVASIYVHEVGHVAALRRYGIDASPPMFVPGFGAFVRMKQYPTDAHEEARTGLAGPLWGLVAAGVAAVYGWLAGSAVALSVASAGATINAFNLIPFWQLDGARGLKALSRAQRLGIVAVGAATALATHQWMPAVVAAFAAPRAFETGPGGPHEHGDRGAFGLFATLIVALAIVASLPASVVF
jgi:Zn-dependent protease